MVGSVWAVRCLSFSLFPSLPFPMPEFFCDGFILKQAPVPWNVAGSSGLLSEQLPPSRNKLLPNGTVLEPSLAGLARGSSPGAFRPGFGHMPTAGRECGHKPHPNQSQRNFQKGESAEQKGVAPVQTRCTQILKSLTCRDNDLGPRWKVAL